MTRITWVQSHARRLPDRDTPVHRELLAAYVTDSCVKEVEKYLADLKLEQAERERM